MFALYDKAVAQIEKTRDSVPHLLSRVVLGVVFALSGWGKLQHLDKVVEFFTSLGIPFASVQAPMVATIELVGGVLLLAGLFTRAAAAALSGTMVVAIITARASDLHGIDDLFGFIEFLYLVLMVHLIIEGAGKLSVDSWAVARRRG